MDFYFTFRDLSEAQFLATLLDDSAKNYQPVSPSDDRSELLRDMAGTLRRFIYDNTPKADDDLEVPY